MVLAACLLALVDCAAPVRIARTSSPLLEPAAAPFTPEARPPRSARLAGPSRPLPLPAVDGEAIAATARGLIGRTHLVVEGKRYTDDCTGLVRAVYARHGIDLFADGVAPGENGVSAIHRFAQRRGGVRASNPRPGDLAFFRETYDRNRDGRRNDGLTHVGIVESVDSDGTIFIVHRVARGVVRYRMNVERPDLRRDPDTGRILNDYLRAGGERRLAGQLSAGFATLR